MSLHLNYLKPPSKAHRDYAKALYDRRNEAIYIPKVNVELPNWKPQINRCHDNCAEWYLNNPNCEIVHGWLSIDLTAIGFYRFIAHSVIKNLDGSFIDITPSLIQTNYPFLKGSLDSDQYFEATDVLHEHFGDSNLDHWI
ncbi:hypothetical protein [Polynucleobacter sp. es-EL-1]|uniref:hypothetical protein n=1 Tax=Polynucleobacter sp. es-EL-1 TaxID=1855652 RepID=UPI001BFE8C5D|nr:hypothetical protein [Polynucleobacter sp. es-EL-1]QWE10246.1 hypothetical protein FD974_07835 [Polynucleobacter sp. es-EL-1]